MDAISHMDIRKVTKLSILPCILLLVNNPLDLSILFPRQQNDNRKDSRLLNLAIITYSVWYMSKLFNKKYVSILVAFIAAFIRFPVKNPSTGIPGDSISFVHHALLFLITHRYGLKLPPLLSVSPRLLLNHFMKSKIKNWPWETMDIERAALQDKTIVRAAVPLNYGYPTKLGTFIYIITDPDLIETVMGDSRTFNTRGYTGFSWIAPLGLLGLPSGDMHSEHRRIIGKFLSENYLKKFAKTIEEEIEVFLGLWMKKAKNKQNVDAYYDMSMVTLDVIMRVGFGADQSELMQGRFERYEDNEKSVAVDHALKIIAARTLMPYQKYFPILNGEKKMAKAMQLREEMNKRLLPTVETRAEMVERNEKEGKDANILTSLLGHKNSDGNYALSMEEIENELHTVRGAGHETSGNTLCWALFLLQKNRDKLEILRNEVNEVLGDKKIASYDDVKKMTYVHAVVYETLRMYPTVPRFPREASVDTMIGDYSCPAGTLVFVSQMALNYNPKYWPNPDSFQPERFAKNLPELHMSKPIGVPDGPSYGFLPFGSGIRTCIGQRLAMLEQAQILASIIRNFDFKLAMDESEVRKLAEITLGPKEGLYLTLTPLT